MTSYVYNPSQKVTEILSKFLEFDPAQLELGIWSGDLSLKNVNLRQDAINPILNKKASKPHTDPKTKPPLHMKLVSGSVGNMRIRIPWKRLVWGQGAVQLEISDVMIVLSLESREETEAKKKADVKAKKSGKNKNKKSEKNEVSQSYREAKQRRLREVERRHLQGMPVALWLDAVHRKNSIEKDAAKLEKEGKKHKKVEEKQEGYLDRWMKNTTSDFFWRFYTGLQGSIKKARIVVVQDGVEVGCIIQSIDVLAGKDDAKMTVSLAGDESMTADITSDEFSNPQNLVYEGAYDDGEHVDKVLKQEGVGVFVRKEASMAKVPQSLRFSSSVTADDYVLRPVNLNLNFSFFYPYPPDRRKKKGADSLSQDTNPTTSTAPSTAAQSTIPGNTTTHVAATQSGAASVSDSTTNASSKRRRGKRDRIKPNNESVKPGPSTETSKLLLETAATLAASSGPRHEGIMRSATKPEYKDRIAALAGDGSGRPHRNLARAGGISSSSSISGRPRIRRHQSMRSLRSYQVGNRYDEPSLALGDLNSVAPPSGEKQVEDYVPRCDCHLSFEDIRVVFSSHHYELLNYFLSTVARMKNGRPDSTIISVLDSDAGALHRHGKFEVPLSPTSLTATIPESTTSKLKSVLLAPLATLGITSLDNGSKPKIQSIEEELPNLRFHIDSSSSLRSQVTRKWWNYAIGAVVFELRKRNSVTTNFQKMYLSFDWEKQRYKRQEYIDLYISVRLESQPQEDHLWSYDNGSREDELLLIEDELPLEQILLYRSIARSIRVRGFKKMPLTVHELNGLQPVSLVGKGNRRGSLTTTGLSGRGTARSNPSQLRPMSGGSTLLSLLHNKYEFAKLLRSKSGVTGRITSGPASDNVLQGDGSYAGHRGHAKERRKASMGFDSAGAGDSGGRAARKSSMGYDSTDGGGRYYSSRTPRNASIGYDSNPGDVQPGQFYTSSRSRDNSAVGDVRTVATKQLKSVKHSRVAEAPARPQDGSMKITFSVQVKSIDLMIIREEFIFDFSPEVDNNLGRSNDAMSRDYFSGEESSEDDVSELSFLTDDQRFFNEQQGQMAAVAEEEDGEGARLSSTDFLNFGLPDNLLLRMTISPLAVAMRGRSGGAKHLSLSIGKITAHGENHKPLLSVGREDSASTPLPEVKLDLPPGSSKKATRRLSEELGLDISVHRKIKRQDTLDSSKHSRHSKRIDELGVETPQRNASAASQSRPSSSKAVSLGCSDDDGRRTVQCDFAQLSVTIDLDAVAKLIQFYLKSEIRYPDKVVAKSSREAARKFMVSKTTSTNSSFGNINTAIRVLGLEVRVPFPSGGDPSLDHVASEASSLYSFGSSYKGSVSGRNPKNSVTVVAADAVELYGGSALDDMCAAQQTDFGTSKSSMWSGSLTSRKVPVKALEMLDLPELTANHDSFSSHHWVLTLSGIDCILDSENPDIPKLTDIPLDVELLVTVNEQSLMETESPKHQFVVEVSPVQVLLSAHRLDLLGKAMSKVDFSVLDGTGQLKKRRNRRKRDPPRIETLSRRVLHSVDLSCKRVRVAIVDDHKATEPLSLKLKEVVMEECISDFLSVVSCFDFSLPNEEALSSAMQICIGRLVGLGLSDDEAWGCTNAARLNLLDDIALMRRAQSDALVQLEGSLRKQSSQLYRTPLFEEEDESGSEVESEPDLSSGESLENSEGGDPSEDDSDDDHVEDVESESEMEDDDSANSAEIVDTTVGNAVEKTMAAFAPLLMEDYADGKLLTPILVIDFPLGARLSTVKLFYDNHLTSFVPSVVVTNSAGIELLTLVPSTANSVGSGSHHQHHPGHGILFSRFDVDKNNSFGRGGLPMSALLTDSGEDDDFIAFRERSRLDDIELGEMEVLFTAKVYEEVIEEISKLRNQKESNDADSFQSEGIQSETSSLSSVSFKPASVESSSVVTAFCVSALMTSDSLVPFSRLTLEGMTYKNKMALLASSNSESKSWMDVPTFLLLADSVSLQNLTPEGQFYPDAIGLLSHIETEAKSFQVRYYKSPDPWKFHSRLNIELRGYRVFLIRQFIHELLQFFVYDRYGVGRLRKKYSKPVFDVNGNGKPPLLYSVNILDSSVLCPRSSTCSDMVAFEVDKVYFGVSYHPESFAMPTQSSHFDKDPGSRKASSSPHVVAERRQSFVSVSDYYDCLKSVSSDHERGNLSSEPISSFDSSWRRRFNITLERIRAFTVIASDSKTRDVIESPLFRFFHAIDGRAEAGKSVYCKRPNVERQPSVSPEALRQAESHEQRWDELSTNYLNLEVLADNAPHTRILIADREGLHPFSLNARLSQFCLLVSCWDTNMQEMPCLFTFATTQVQDSASPPKIPDDFPAYATEEFVSRMEELPIPTRSEICVIFKKLQLRCTFDSPGFFAVDPDCFQHFPDPACPLEERTGLVISFSDAVVHVVNDFLNIKRIGVGASSLVLVDERRHTSFQQVLSVRPPVDTDMHKNNGPPAWADLKFGLREDVRTLNGSLPMPFQLSVFMTRGWSMINLGANRADGVMHDMSWIWLFLDFFTKYYKDIAFGNPGHQAQRWAHKVKNSLRKATGNDPVEFVPIPGSCVDFRMWLCQPFLCVPSEYRDPRAPCIRLEAGTGLWYRFKSIRDMSSHEVVSTDIDMYFLNEFQAPNTWRRLDVRNAVSGKRPLVEGLSFGLRYDCNNACNHKDITVKIPFVGPTCAVTGRELEVQPILLASPTVCTPVETPHRVLGPKVCEITCIIEVLPLASATLINFFKGPPEVNEEFAPPEEDQGPPTFSACVSVRDLRIYAIDPVLGVQLPVAVLSISAVELTASKFATEPSIAEYRAGESPPEDLHLTADCHLWADYFKLGITRSWEPLLEPYKCLLLCEKSKDRGQGMSLESDSPLHLNLSSALLQVMGETIESFTASIGETFGEQANAADVARRSSMRKPSPSRDRVGAIVEDEIKTMNGVEVTVFHEIPKPLKSDDRVAFSLRNLTGQKIRVHQQTDVTSDVATSKPAIVTYLNQVESMGLTFNATISVIKNLSIVEVPYPGLPNSRHSNRYQGSLKHAVDVQVPGFRWLQGIKVDTFGRKFEALAPRSIDVREKIFRDWRLKNALMLLTEVGLESGGRSVTVRSLFEVRNSTTHPLKICFNPDPTYRPITSVQSVGLFPPSDGEDDTIGDVSSHHRSTHHTVGADEVEIVEPGESFQVPTLLLERALQMPGSHLGCVWMCPDIRDAKSSFLRSFHAGEESEAKELNVGFSSRPVQLAKVVHESSLIFQSGSGEDIPVEKAKSGVQVSCPTRGIGRDGHAPFCYAIEVGRSPIVSNRDKEYEELGKDLSHGTQAVEKRMGNLVGAEKRAKKTERIHGPVAYTLSIHAPLVVVNLLPEGGRFELMHAIRRTVLWYADLEPGQQIPVHSVGLDAPLLLLVNLGFCRTPVGEGALVHHGADSQHGGKEQAGAIKSIGKVVTKGTKQIGKTLTAISDSPDKRQGLLNKRQNPQLQKEKTKQKKAIAGGSLGMDTGVGGIEDVDGKIHSVESITYSPGDVATETTVVDGVGQRLTLNIENVRGGGGQRRISLFSPFWIVNTTEHSLRYKQEKGNSFVSGTVLSPSADGSAPVDGSNRNYRSRHRMQHSRRRVVDGHVLSSKDPMNSQTIFSGTPGALATSYGRCDLEPSHLANLIDKDMPLETLARIAFMFNFHEDKLSIGQQTLCVQLCDGTGKSDYISEWSRGFSLDSVGFSQIVGMNCKEGRTLELSVTVNVAPGFLSGYTKIVRFLPRYVVLNRLERPIRLWQDSSVFRPTGDDRVTANVDGAEPSKEARRWRYSHEEKHHRERINQYESMYGRPAILEERKVEGISEGTTAHRSAFYITTVGPCELLPFHLPDSRGERQLRVDLGAPFNVTASVAADFPGEHTLKVARAVDLRLLNHVSTRAAPKYKIVLPPPDDAGIGQWDGELGVFFETDWGGDRKIIVKGTKRGKYAFNHTDIHVGDELLRIDGVSVVRMSFTDAMKLLKERLTAVAAAYSNQQQRRAEEHPKRGQRRLSLIPTLMRRGSTGSTKQGDGDENSPPRPTHLSLTFRTLEERLRKVRVKAGREGGGHSSFLTKTMSKRHLVDDKPLSKRQIGGLDDKGKPDLSTQDAPADINVEMKSMHNTMFVILRSQDADNPPFCIQNRSINYIIFYRQRGCDNHPWNRLKPGESQAYSWEEPMKSKKLTVRVASNSQDVARTNDPALSAQDSSSENGTDANDTSSFGTSDVEKRSMRTARLKQSLAYQFVDSEERGGYGASITVRLEEIGYKTFLPTPAKDSAFNGHTRRNFLNCEVDTDGGTRLLIISDDERSEDERGVLSKHVQTLEKQIAYEEERRKSLYELRFVLTQPVSSGVNNPNVREESFNDEEVKTNPKDRSEDRDTAVENDAKRLVEDYPEETTVTRRDQVVVEVQEAVGLNPTDFIGGCNPYCEVSLKGRSQSRKHLFQKRHKQKTYFIEKSLSPKWKDQIFVFDVPRAAVRVTRGHSIEVKLRNFRLVGQHSILGQASVHFGSLRDQRELEGWYPLAGRAGRRDVETASLSEWGRGSVKLRVQWIYTIPALLDYFLLLAERRLVELTKSRLGMTNQLAHALASDQRKREARDNSGGITKLAKVQRKKKNSNANKPPSTRVIKAASSRAMVITRGNSNSPGKSPRRSPANIKRGLGGRVGALQQALKMSREKYLYALYFQTIESRRNRQGEQEDLQALTDTPNEHMNLNNKLTMGSGHNRMSLDDALPMIKELKSPMPGRKDSLGKTKKSLEAFFSSQSPGASKDLPFRQSPEKFQSHQKSLDDFFSQQKGVDLPLTKPTTQVKTPFSPGIRRGSRIFGDKGRQLATSHRRLSLDIDLEDGVGGDQEVDQWEPSLRQGQAIYESIVRETSDFGISDLLSVNTDQDDELKRKMNVMHLMDLGFVFHKNGDFFHTNHLPNHFRRSLFASSMTDKKSSRLYRPKWAVGSSSCIRQFKSYQAANNIFWDAELEVIKNEDSFTLQLKDKRHATPKEKTNFSESKIVISEKLAVPDIAPKLSIERSLSCVEFMVLCRDKFERTCKRSLKTALNPGGWLTIRPITALNLPDTYTGMHVKLRYGSEVISSETVDAKVTPRWTPDDFFDSSSGAFNPALAPKNSDGGSVAGFKRDGNDLIVPVEPQQTSGSIKISVIAERMNTKAELGVLHIPLGAAIAACIDCAEDVLDSSGGASTDPPVYIRWFPLMNPRTTVPVEGDMGLSNRPKESEKVLDSMFQQYFAPCIQLALIWSPDSTQNVKKESVDDDEDQPSTTFSFADPEVPEAPMMQNYVNADIGRISAALIDSQKATELLSFSALDIDVRYSVTKSKTRIGLVVGWIQLDNQEGRAREPVVLAPTPALHRQPTLQILAVKDNLRSKSNIVSYDYIGVALQEMDLTVEEAWIFDLWEFFMGIMRRQRAKKQTVKGERRADVLLTSENCFAASDSEDTETDPTLLSLLETEGDGESPSTRRKVYIEQLILGLVKLNLSYVKGKNKQSWELTDEGARKIKHLEAKELPNLAIASGAINLGNQEKKDQSETFVRWSQHTYDEELLAENGGTMTYNLPGLIAAVFPSVSEAPIRLQGKAIDHVFESPGEILSSIKNFYVNETLKQVYKIIGSLDFVGNPTVIFSSFVSGVKDLVVAPTSAFLKSPTNVNKVGIGVAKGTISLFSHSASGIFGFVAKASATAGQAAAILSLDAEYSQWHREQVVTEATNLNRVWKRRGVQSVSEMLTRPVGDIILGVAMGASGVFLSPYKGLRRGGTLGLVQGVAAGTAGIVAKPLVGVLDALTHFTATAHDIARSVNVLERRYQPAIKLRLPYSFGPMKILSPFDPVTARSVYLLKIFPSKSRGNKQRRGDVARWKEIHIASEVLHMEPDVETYAIATTVRVVLIKLKKDNNGSLVPSFCWEVDLTGRAVVSSRVSDHGHNGVALTITMRAQAGKKRRRKGDVTKDENAASAVPPTLERGLTTVSGVPMTTLERGLTTISGIPLTTLDRGQSSGVFPSSRSVGSYFSTGDDTGTDEYLGSEGIHHDSRSVSGDPQLNYELQPGGGDSEVELDTDFQKHGAARKDGEVLEWFTVLSEYQHRPQLTNLHNAISNIVGDFGAVIVEPGREVIAEGVTTFGMFEFESGLPDGRASQAANAELVVALENLPWMHENVFKEYRGKSRAQQRQALSALRQNWVFSRDLEASMVHGGPAWLVEARARAMFVSAEAPVVPEFVDPQDPDVREVLQQLEQGNISVEQATELLYSHEVPDSDFEDNASDDHRLISSSEDSSDAGLGGREVTDEVDRSLPPVFVVQHDDNVSKSGAKTDKQSDNFSEQEEVFESLEFEISDNPIKQSGDDAGSLLGSQRDPRRALDRPESAGMTSDDHTIDSQLSLGLTGKKMSPQSVADQDAPALGARPSNSLSFDTAVTELASAPGPLPTTPSTVSEQQQKLRHHSEHQRTIYSVGTASNSMAHSESRMDRMETLMEQLVILNATQAHRQATAGVEQPGSDNNSVNSATKVARSLRSELADLKAQVVARTQEDEALRSEISLLRQQLAERRANNSISPGPSRATRDSSKSPSNRMRFPNFGAFGAGKKQQEVESKSAKSTSGGDSHGGSAQRALEYPNLTAPGPAGAAARRDFFKGGGDTNTAGAAVQDTKIPLVDLHRANTGSSTQQQQGGTVPMVELKRSTTGESVTQQRRIPKRINTTGSVGSAPRPMRRRGSGDSEHRQRTGRRGSGDSDYRQTTMTSSRTTTTNRYRPSGGRSVG